MTIISLRLSQIGRHESLLCDFNASVAGLLGPNGVGKSTILRTIRALLTGKVGSKQEDTLTSLVRDNFKHGSGEAEMTFRKNGQTCRVVLRINKSGTTRKLFIGDAAPVTAAAAVDSLLRDMLGADKRSVMDCVFVPQGALTNVLFGALADREKMFLRMIGCAHWASVSQAAAAQAAILRVDIQDLGPALEEAHRVQGEHSARFHELRAELAQIEDQTDRINHWERLLRSRGELTSATASRVQAHTRLSQALAAYNPAAVPETAAAQLQAMITAQEQNLEQRSATIEGTRQLLEGERQLLALLPGFKRALDEQTRTAALVLPPDREAEVAQLRLDWAATSERVHGMKNANGRAAAWQRLLELSTSVSMQREEAQRNEQTHRTAWMASDQACRAMEATHVPAMEKLRLQISLYRTFLDHTHGTAVTCPVCEAKLSKKMSPEDVGNLLSSAALEEERISVELERARAAATQDFNNAQRAGRELVRAQAALEQHNQSIAEARNTGSDVAVFTSEAEIKAEEDKLLALEQQGHALTASQAERAKMQHEIERARTEWLEWTKHPQIVKLTVSAREPGKLEAAVAQMQGELINMIDQREAQGTQLRQMRDLLTRLTEAEAAYHAACALERQWQAAQEQPELTVDNLNQMIGEARTKQNHRISMVASRDEVQRLVNGAEAQIQRLVDLQLTHNARLHLASQMDLVAETFGRDGVMRTYLRDVFDVVLQVLGPHLQRMNANFMVRKGEGILDFEFMRTDEASEWMPQNMMSGGQRVKMSVAFLMVMQQVIIPDVGLLVLDEPTTHLDEESREGFADLIEDMAAVLQAKECQVLVCDHSKEILAALKKKVVLAVGAPALVS